MGVFPDECTVDQWYNAVLKLKNLNPGEGKYSLEKVSPEWYTLDTEGDVLTFIDGVLETDLKEYRAKSFWLLLPDVGGLNMPIIPKQTFLS
ncbi:13456_t:CDS:1, partial [Dentiscutata erythropus]